MNRKQLQLEVCKALLDVNNRVFASELNEHEIAVTTTGFDVVVFDKNEIVFDASKIRKTETLKKVLSDSDTDEPIKSAKELFKSDDKIYEKYKGENIEIYVNASIAKKFNGFVLFANSEHGRILAKDQLGRTVGAFLPVKYDKKKDVKQ